MLKHKYNKRKIEEYRFMDPIGATPIQVFIGELDSAKDFVNFFNNFDLEVKEDWYESSKWLTITQKDNSTVIIYLKEYKIDTLIHEFSHTVRRKLINLWIKTNDDELFSYCLWSLTWQFFSQANIKKFTVSETYQFYNYNNFYNERLNN